MDTAKYCGRLRWHAIGILPVTEWLFSVPVAPLLLLPDELPVSVQSVSRSSHAPPPQMAELPVSTQLETTAFAD